MKTAHFDSFKNFLTGAGKSILGTSLFYAIWLVIDQVVSANYGLKSFSGRMIGIATLEGVDVGVRITVFYKCVLLFFVAFFIFCSLGYLIYKKNKDLLSSSEVRIANVVSLAGIFLFVFKVFGTEVYESLEMIYFLHKIVVVSLILRLLFFKKNRLSVYQIAGIISVAFAGYFFIADVNNLAGYSKNPDFYITTFIISCLLIFSFNVLIKNSKTQNKSLEILFSLSPILALPLISVLKDEIFLVFKSNHVGLNNLAGIYISLLILLILLVMFRYKKVQKRGLLSEKDLVARSYFPMLIFSLAAYTSYSYYTDYYNEIFESGNVYLPIMEYKLFGVLSPLEKLNTHLLSDYFFSAIYSFFNGLKINEITLYDFMLAPISITLHYYLIRFITRSEFVAILCVMLFPYAEALMPAGFCLAILGVFATYKTLGPNQSLKKYVLYFMTLFFLACWRIDLGVNCLITMPLVLLFYHLFDPNYRINLRVFFKALAIVGGSILGLVGILSAYRQTNFFAKIPYFLNYCSSAQSYGHEILGQTNLPSYKMHYFIFPVFVGLVLIALIINYKQLNATNSKRLAYLSLVFLCVFYFVNFNRGLTRHCLAEGSDVFTSSYLYLIMGGSAFVFLKKENQIIKAIVFFMIVFFLVNNYNVPSAGDFKSLTDVLVKKVENTQNIKLSKIESRIKGEPKTDRPRYNEFSDFINTHTQPTETFVDFANRPMLYFFSKKITPSWFYQNPLCIQNDFLQKKFIEDLKKYKTPFLLFSAFNQPGADLIDGVPNTLRHYRLAEYFYNNFKPFVVVDGTCVWQQKELNTTNKIDTLFKFYSQPNSQEGGQLINTVIKVKAEKKYLIKVVSTGNPSGDLKVFGDKSVLSTTDFFKNNRVFYYTFNATGKQEKCLLQIHKQNTSELLILECDYFPDLYSDIPLTYNFKQLPYVWGKYDKLVLKEKSLFESSTRALLEKNAALTLTIPKNLDKSSGNTLLITCKNSHDKIQKVNLVFGNVDQINKTQVSFDIVPSTKEETYAIRVSSIYKWFSADVNQLILEPEIDKKITITNIRITKGD